MSADTEHTTQLLLKHVAGDRVALRDLTEHIYRELRALAEGFMADERAGHTLQPTALVHEAYLKLVRQDKVDWNGRTHFLAIACRQMRRILVNHARKRGAQKRGGDHQRVTLCEELHGKATRDFDLEAMSEALTRLADAKLRLAQVVELRYFGGLTVEEISRTLGIGERTVRGDWRTARAWLLSELNEEAP